MIIKCKELKIWTETEEKELVNISFEIDNSLAIVGESGSGKSLTLKSLIDLLPKNLKYRLDIDSSFKLVRGDTVAFIPQNPFTALSPMTKISKQWFNSKDKAKKLFQTLKLNWELFFKYPPQLSGGELQRVIFAMALSSNPKLLLLDEPTTALDPNLRDEIAKTLIDLQREFNFLMIFVTHDINLASKICKNIMILKDGKVVQKGDMREIFLNPKDDYTKSLIEASFANREFRE
jgi:peptide/nickel transport system ATP-binding protein